MFINYSQLLTYNPPQLNYGLAVTDLDGDGQFELFVAGYGFPNLLLKWDGKSYGNISNSLLADPRRHAIGVATADIDGDGREEIYILNSDSFSGQKRAADRLFAESFDGWVDLFEHPRNAQILNLTAGRSVVCVDRFGTGRYGFFVANYGGPICLYELDDDGGLINAAPAAQLNLTTGGRSAISLPLISTGMDIFAANEHGPNFLFRNRGDGTFEELAQRVGLADAGQNGRGVAVLDANDNGYFDIVVGNWEGPHRLFLRQLDGTFQDHAPNLMAEPSRVRTVIAADFDNDGYEEIFFNNIGQPNRLFGRRGDQWVQIGLGDALEPNDFGTGAVVADLDGDGRLELIIAHGESGAQPLTLYRAAPNQNAYLRVLPLTVEGAPARGALVVLQQAHRTQRRAIDAGSGYLCQMEPLAHFGLGQQPEIEQVQITWPDGTSLTIAQPAPNQVLRVPHPRTL